MPGGGESVESLKRERARLARSLKEREDAVRQMQELIKKERDQLRALDELIVALERGGRKRNVGYDKSGQIVVTLTSAGVDSSDKPKRGHRGGGGGRQQQQAPSPAAADIGDPFDYVVNWKPGQEQQPQPQPQQPQQQQQSKRRRQRGRGKAEAAQPQEAAAAAAATAAKEEEPVKDWAEDEPAYSIPDVCIAARAPLWLLSLTSNVLVCVCALLVANRLS